ncbi:MAG TPA: type III PLP-dependent enzyme [Phycisphaerae bacterium]|nr:type III PLP-dependent enzyme [Phycisphaerae bacterium]
MVSLDVLKKLAREHGTPLFVIDHEELRRRYRQFKRRLPRVQVYYAVKANPEPEIVQTFYEIGGSFDVASVSEFAKAYRCIRRLPARKRQEFIWDKIIYSHPIKDNRTLEQLEPYKPLVVYDNHEEIGKIRRHAPSAGLVLRLRVPNTGSLSELSSKFGAAPGEAVELIEVAQRAGLTVEGLSFHVGSQCTNFENYVQALNLSAGVFAEARSRGYQKLKLLDIGGGFPVPYDAHVAPFAELAKTVNAEIRRLFPPDIEILAEPGRFLVATAGLVVATVIGKAWREGKLCYYIDDGVYHTFSGIMFDHCQYRLEAFKRGPKQICSVFGPTCDGLDVVSLAEELPELKLGDRIFARNIGAYSHASSTHFNGFPPAKVVHVNR